MDRRELICIGCPLGCNLEVLIDNGSVVKIQGNTCKRGEDYAKKECINPTRIVTSMVSVEGGKEAVVSVKTEKDIPKNLIFECIRILKGITLKAPVKIGDVVVENLLGTGVNIIATSSADKE